MILPELVKAVARLDEKVGIIANCLGPLAADIQYVKLGAKFDQEVLKSLVAQALRYPTETSLEESKVKNLDGLSALAHRKGLDDDVTQEMAESRAILADFDTAALVMKVRGSLNNDIAGLLAKFNSEAKRQIKHETDSALSLMHRVIRVAQDASDKAEEAKVMVGEDVETKIALVRDEILNGLTPYIEKPIQEIKDKCDRRFDEAENSIERVTLIMDEMQDGVNAVEESMETIRDMVSRNSRNVDAAIDAAKTTMDREHERLRSDIKRQIKLSDKRAEDFLDQTDAETSSIITETNGKVDAMMTSSRKEIDGLLSELESKYDSLKALASRSEDAILSVEKTTASVGNSTPRNLRHKIRISNG